MKTTVALITLSSIFACLTLSAQETQPAHGGGLAERFKQLDRNGDGKVSREEGSSLTFFDAVDGNKDGFLTAEEARAYFAARRATRPAAPSSGSAEARVPAPSTPARPRGAGTGDLVMPEEPPHKKHLNLRYAEVAGVDPNLLSLDLYVPDDKQAVAKRPVMIMIHGGGWRGGDKASPPIVGAKMRHFVGHGYIYVSINYRLSPREPASDGIKHPTHAMDCAKAIAWIHDHVAEYGGDPARMHLMGHSAGGHLAAILGINERFLKAHGKDLSILKSNVLLDPAAIDIPRYVELENGRAMTALYELAFGQDPANQLDASPQQHVALGKHIPPTLLFYAGDRMKLNVLAPAFVEALTKAGSPSAAVDTITLDHGQINSHIGMVDEPMTALIMRLHAGEDASRFPPKIDREGTDQPGQNSRSEQLPAQSPKSNPSAWITPAVEAPQVEFHTFQSKAAATGVSFHLFKPEAYETARDRRFPVLYWLHGTGGGLAGVAPLSAFFDCAMRDGKIPPMLIAFPNGLPASMWCDAKDGSVPVETIIVKELVPHIDANFRTIAAREGRILEGFSMGGYGAARLGFKYPELFAAVSIFAGGPLDLEFQGPRATGNPAERERILQATFGGDLNYFRAQSPFTIAERNAAAIQGRVRVRQVVGSRDNTAELNRFYSTHLRKLGVDHEFVEVPGVGHDTMALLQALDDRLWEFYRVTLAAATAPTTKPADSTQPKSSAAHPSSPPLVAFKRDYQAGTKDARGQFMGGTESQRRGGRLHRMEGHGHNWPGRAPRGGVSPLTGPSTAELNAAEVVWPFLVSHPKASDSNP
jgi:acetyl esterase/lipase